MAAHPDADTSEQHGNHYCSLPEVPELQLPPDVSPERSRLIRMLAKKWAIPPGEQIDFSINPQATRDYDIRTFGESDTVIVLFEDVDGELRYTAGDDDSGEDFNASLRIRLFKGRKYVLRVRLYYANASGETAVMMW